jgi:hypothetical protein
VKATINFETDNLIVEAFGYRETFDMREEMVIQGWDDAWFVLGLERDDKEAYFELDFNLVWNEGEEPIMSVYPVVDGKKFHTSWERCELKIVGERKEYEHVNKDIEKDIRNYYNGFITLRNSEFVEETIHLTDENIKKVISRMATKGDKIVLYSLERVLENRFLMALLSPNEKEKLQMIIDNPQVEISIEKNISLNFMNKLKNNGYDVYGFINKGYAVKKER